MHGNGAEAVGIRGVKGVFGQPDVAEALEGIGRLEDILLSAADVNVFVLCRAVIGIVEVAVAVQHLAVMHHNPAPARGTDSDFHVTGHVLTEVDHQLVFRRAEDCNRGNPLMLGNPLAHLRNQPGLYRVLHRFADRFDRRGQVDRFAHINIGREHRRCQDIPAGGSCNRVGGAVGIGQGQRGDEGHMIGGVMVVVTVADAADRPALPDTEREQVFPGAEHAGDIVGLHLDAVFVGCPAGCQDGVPDACAVEFGGVDPDCGRLKRCFFQRFVAEREGLLVAVDRHPRIARRGDPASIV